MKKSRKHAIFLAAHFEPESNAGAKRLSALAKFLVSAGWQVTVVTQLPHHPQNAIYEGWADVANRMETLGSMRVIRLRPWLVNKDNLFLRLLSETYFVARALRFLLREKPDVYITSIPYMFVAQGTLFAARLRRAAFVLDVRDLTWQYPKAAGRRTFGLDRVLDWMMQVTARRADLVTATTQGQLRHFKGLQKGRLFLPNGVTKDVFDRLAALPAPFNPARARIKVVYVGLFGFNHNLTTILEAARLTPSADFILVGDGPDRARLEKNAAKLSNVEILSYRPFDELVAIYADADILVSHFRKNPVFTVVQSAKIWEYMATNRPIIHATEGESVELMIREQIGLAIEPDNPQAMSAAIGKLTDDLDEARRMATRALNFVQEERIREKLFRRLEASLQEITESYSSGN